MNLKPVSAAVLLCLLSVAGQASQVTVDPNDIAIVQARAQLENIEKLVLSGVLPRLKLDQAKENLEDARDIAILHQTLYGKELTVDQADEMISAAQRRVERKRKAQADMQKLFNQGIVSKAETGSYADEVERANSELEWAKNRAKLILELSAMARAEQDAEKLAALSESLRQAGQRPLFERFDGNGFFGPGVLVNLQTAFQKRFGVALPVSANGETAVHRAFGFDHRGRVDVAVSPDQPQGAWLRRYLTDNRIPFLSFRSAVPHKATGAHFHLGPPSTSCVVNSCPVATD